MNVVLVTLASKHFCSGESGVKGPTGIDVVLVALTSKRFVVLKVLLPGLPNLM